MTEYGVHWNFFFTLAVLPVLGTLLWPVRRTPLRWSAIGLLVTLRESFLSFKRDIDTIPRLDAHTEVHEVALRKLGLIGWIMSNERVGLLGMNKEGLVSLAG